MLDKDNPDVYAYTRETRGKIFLVLLNFRGKNAKENIGIDSSKARAVINNYESAAALDGTLRPCEAAIFEL